MKMCRKKSVKSFSEIKNMREEEISEYDVDDLVQTCIISFLNNLTKKQGLAQKCFVQLHWVHSICFQSFYTGR